MISGKWRQKNSIFILLTIKSVEEENTIELLLVTYWYPVDITFSFLTSDYVYGVNRQEKSSEVLLFILITCPSDYFSYLIILNEVFEINFGTKSRRSFADCRHLPIRYPFFWNLWLGNISLIPPMMFLYFLLHLHFEFQFFSSFILFIFLLFLYQQSIQLRRYISTCDEWEGLDLSIEKWKETCPFFSFFNRSHIHIPIVHTSLLCYFRVDLPDSFHMLYWNELGMAILYHYSSEGILPQMRCQMITSYFSFLFSSFPPFFFLKSSLHVPVIYVDFFLFKTKAI